MLRWKVKLGMVVAAAVAVASVWGGFFDGHGFFW